MKYNSYFFFFLFVACASGAGAPLRSGLPFPLKARNRFISSVKSRCSSLFKTNRKIYYLFSILLLLFPYLYKP